MKNKGLLLNIEQPCQEKWSDMQFGTQGKFCDNCSKSVIDMVNLSDEEITAIIAQNSSKICARLSKRQINKPIKTTSKKKLSFNKIVSGLFLIGWTSYTTASPKHLTSTELINTPLNQNTDTTYRNKITDEHEQQKHVIQGTVRDAADKKELSGITIQIRNTRIGTITDKNGAFKLDAPLDMDIKKIILDVAYIGYLDANVYAYNKSKQAAISEIFLLQDDDTLIGEVCIVKRKNGGSFGNKRLVV